MYILKKLIKRISLSVFFISAEVFALQLGDGTKTDSKEFIHVMDNCKDVSIWDMATYVIKDDGSLWGTGVGVYKYFKIGNEENSDVFVHLYDGVKEFSKGFILLEDNSLISVFNNFAVLDNNVDRVFGNAYLKNNKLYKIDFNLYNNPRKLISIDVIDYFASELKENIVLKNNKLIQRKISFLNNYEYGQENIETIAENVIKTDMELYITKENKLYVYGFSLQGYGFRNSNPSQKDVVFISDDVVSAKSNQYDLIFKKRDGNLYALRGESKNYYNELGPKFKNPTKEPKLLFENVNSYALSSVNVAVVKNDGSLWVCGANDYPGLM